jgi:D-alanyl-lipoteichoic acid acyltransferase DltB (MBOAT superfamily)
LPVGISFYTFQTMSYTIDVYNKRLEAEKNIFYFLLYVSYFPQLVAGPIERANYILPQLKQKVTFDMNRISRGLIFVVYGFFQKVVIADNLAIFTEIVFNNAEKFKGISIVIGTFLFGFQIYNDFYGYTNIARGVALILGVELSPNFRQPFFADSIRTFWKRWHISLTTWFRDYLYIPLGGNKVKIHKWILLIIITFTISGLWHGANLTYILWGFLNAVFFLLETFLEKINFFKKIYTEKYKYFRILVTFVTLNLLWIIFRANSISDIFILLDNLFTFDTYIHFDRKWLLVCFILVAFSIIFDLIETKKNFAVWVESKNIFLKNIIIYFMIMAIIFIGNWHLTPFIYFQF